MSHSIAYALIGLFLTSYARTQDRSAEESLDARVDRLVNERLEQARIPGVAVAVLRAGEIVLAEGYGIANVEHRVPVTPETIFQSGSVGKQFTAALVMQLVEKGDLGLEDSVADHLPGAPESWEPITVRHLLSHTSGLGDYPGDLDLRRDYTEDELLQRIYETPLAFAPGERWSYSNLGYVTLGILVGKRTGRFYGDLLEERIFEPLGMETARVISESEIVMHRAAGYLLRGGELRNQEWVSPSINTTADGALYFSVLDVAHWDAGLYGEGILSRESLETMWTPTRLNDGTTVGYGFGWNVGEAMGHRVVEHGGAWQGFTAHISRLPEDQLTVVVLANRAGADSSQLAREIMAIFVPGLAPAAPR